MPRSACTPSQPIRLTAHLSLGCLWHLEVDCLLLLWWGREVGLEARPKVRAVGGVAPSASASLAS